MNVDTGYLRELTEEERAKPETIPQDLTPVPMKLNRAARRKLAGRKETYVSLTSGGKLSRWAAQERKKRRKMEREARRRNRRR